MKMTAIEKRFVNSSGHTIQVAHRAQLLLDRVRFQDGWRYLDVGCGVGATACEIARTSGLDVTGVDVDPQQIAAAQARGANSQLHFEAMDAIKLQFHDAEFDIVASSMATHHMPRWEQAFSEMIRVLRPGGYLIYSDFMFPSWLATIGRLIPVAGIPTRLRVERLASIAGLTKIYQSRAGLQYDFIWLRTS